MNEEQQKEIRQFFDNEIDMVKGWMRLPTIWGTKTECIATWEIRCLGVERILHKLFPKDYDFIDDCIKSNLRELQKL